MLDRELGTARYHSAIYKIIMVEPRARHKLVRRAVHAVSVTDAGCTFLALVLPAFAHSRTLRRAWVRQQAPAFLK